MRRYGDGRLCVLYRRKFVKWGEKWGVEIVDAQKVYEGIELVENRTEIEPNESN